MSSNIMSPRPNELYIKDGYVYYTFISSGETVFGYIIENVYYPKGAPTFMEEDWCKENNFILAEDTSILDKLVFEGK